MPTVDWVPLATALLRPPLYGVGAAAVPLRAGRPGYIRITDISANGRFTPSPKVGVDHPDADRHRLAPGELVVARTGASVGKSYLYNPLDGDLVYAGFLIHIAPDPDRLDPRYLALFMQTDTYWNWVARTSVRSGQPGINGREFCALPIPFPALPEQQRIAESVATSDAHIATVEQLLQKQKCIRTGVSQQLLTGRTRLAGFTAAWREARLGDVLRVRHGRSQRAVESETGSVPILASGGQIGWAERPIYDRPSVLIGRKGTIDRPHYQATPFWSVDTLFYTEIAASADPKFLFYLFQTIDWRSMNEASGVPSLSSSRVEGVPVRLPELDEQTRIRQVLDDVSAEVRALERLLDKLRDVRVGMMQELFASTGQSIDEVL